MEFIDILIIILIILLIIFLILCFIFIILLLFPHKYDLILSYKDANFDINFSIIFIKANFHIIFKWPLEFKLTILNRVLVDSKDKKKNDNLDEGASIKDTDFISNKDIENEVTKGNDEIKKLFVRAKEYEKELDKEANAAEKEFDESLKEIHSKDERKVFAFIDKFKNIFPKDLIDLIKLGAREMMPYIHHFYPSKCKVNLNIGSDDPYTTGIMMAFAAPIYSAIGSELSLTPNFKKSEFSGDVHFIGKPQIIFIVTPMFKLFINDRFRTLFLKGKKKK